MKRLFAYVRRSLLESGQTGKYLRYAFGEIILVMIGILLALQVNNWNEKRQAEARFRTVLEQLYTVIDEDRQNLQNIEHLLSQQLELAHALRENPGSTDGELLPSLLYYLDTYPSPNKERVSFLINSLSYDPENYQESKIAKSLAFYAFSDYNLGAFSKPLFTPLLLEAGLPQPSLTFGYSAIDNFTDFDRAFFTPGEQSKVRELLQTETFQARLTTLLSQKDAYRSFIVSAMGDARSNLELIRQYHPGARLLYQNIGLVGPATLHQNWETNVALTLTDPTQSVWEGTVTLSDGFVKFRDGSSWLANWGGNSFPAGEALWFSNNIAVRAGTYRVTLNLSDKTYHFEPVNP